jgi:acylphosphatase
VERATLHLNIQGRVQGVGYRYAAAAEAERLGLQGWVRNRRDGSVEAVVCGTAEACHAFAAWASRGPPAARVDRVQSRPASAEELASSAAGFVARPTI